MKCHSDAFELIYFILDLVNDMPPCLMTEVNFYIQMFSVVQ